MLLNSLQKAIFTVNKDRFETLALEIFRVQSEQCVVYRQYLQFLQTDVTKINKLEDIPYLPIDFFKSFLIQTGTFQAEKIFESSSTTGLGISKHLIKSVNWYRKSFTNSFSNFFGDPEKYCHLALLPSYLERDNSSLIFQTSDFITQSQFETSDFYLYNLKELSDQIRENEENKIPTIVWGVTFALLDFADTFKFNLKHTIIIETGGMKGRRKEIVREELHTVLKNAFGTTAISGEYGMTELTSQAYSVKEGVYSCPPWMKVTGREINDPFTAVTFGKNCVLNIIDLANIDSCCFIATSDIAKIYQNGDFEVLGRLDNSDTRGCNLLI